MLHPFPVIVPKSLFEAWSIIASVCYGRMRSHDYHVGTIHVIPFVCFNLDHLAIKKLFIDKEDQSTIKINKHQVHPCCPLRITYPGIDNDFIASDQPWIAILASAVNSMPCSIDDGCSHMDNVMLTKRAYSICKLSNNKRCHNQLTCLMKGVSVMQNRLASSVIGWIVQEDEGACDAAGS